MEDSGPINLRPYVDKPDRYYGTQQENPLAWIRNLKILKNGLQLGDHGRKPPTYLTSSAPSAYSYESGPASSVNTMDRLAEDFTKALKIHMANLNPVGQQQQQGYEVRGPRREVEGVKCYACNEYGHIGRNCPNRRGEYCGDYRAEYSEPSNYQQQPGKGRGQ
ncbi:hypothetical protein BCR42DRAFT_392141 [Absidia repens]|uniref:CCHC-type domain-containing protein n=1 Tax=Absidia repens TaxID=90262 RepID=A0A1X2IIY2_9FUNG|nr:hypothetical protein BCR42DRAFT_392141 [Absidia repens]